MKQSNSRNRYFAFIKAMIIEHGSVARIHLTRAFAIASAQATRILAAYREARLDSIELDSSDKVYKAGRKFSTAELNLFNVDAKRFLDAAQVLAGEDIVQIRTIIR